MVADNTVQWLTFVSQRSLLAFLLCFIPLGWSAPQVSASNSHPIKTTTLTPLVIASSVNNSAMTRMIESRLTTAYQALGYRLTVQYLPAGRSLMMSNNGDFDGELFRIQSISTEYPNLLRVPAVLTTLELYAFVRQPSTFDVDQWQHNKTLRIGYVRGFKMAEQYVYSGEKIAVTTTAQAVTMLKQGKVDVLLDDVESVLQVHGSLTKHSDIRRLPSALSRAELYHFLHKKHQALLKPLAAELQKSAKNH